ncbi:MAG: divalent-cation tolerance protein CutA, partial [Proteobacteria bacterium]|nr:divalent-cation tolerance protein CutA [Pseudomonadota bacterium]
MDSAYLLVMMTASSEAEAASIGRKVVEERLAACCNILPGVRSIYRWQGKISDESEALCTLKTRSELFDKLKARIKELHSYEVPEVIAIDIE